MGQYMQYHPSFVRLTSNVYRYQDDYINVGKCWLMAGHATCLMGLARLRLFCLPKCQRIEKKRGGS